MAIQSQPLSDIQAKSKVVLESSDLVDNEVLGREIRKLLKAGEGITVTEDADGSVVISSTDMLELNKKFMSTMVNPVDNSDYPLLWTDVATGSSVVRHLSPNGSKNGYVYCTDNMFHYFYNGTEYLVYDQYSRFTFRIPRGYWLWYHNKNVLVSAAACNSDMKVMHFCNQGVEWTPNLIIYDYKTKQHIYQYNTYERTAGKVETGPITEPQVWAMNPIRLTVNDKTGHFIIIAKIAKTYESWNEDQTKIVLNYEWRKIGYWVFDAEKLKFIKWNNDTQVYDEFDECFTEDGMTEFTDYDGYEDSNIMKSDRQYDLVTHRSMQNCWEKTGDTRTGNGPWIQDSDSETLNSILDKNRFKGVNTELFLIHLTKKWKSTSGEDGTTTYTSYDAIWLFDEHDQTYPLSDKVKCSVYEEWGGKIRFDNSVISGGHNAPNYKISGVICHKQPDSLVHNTQGIEVSNNSYSFVISKSINWDTMEETWECNKAFNLFTGTSSGNQGYVDRLQLTNIMVEGLGVLLGNYQGEYGGNASVFWLNNNLATQQNELVPIQFPFRVLGSNILQLAPYSLCCCRLGMGEGKVQNWYMFVGGYNAPTRGAICVTI